MRQSLASPSVPGIQWTFMALGFFAAMLGACLLALNAHERRQRRWVFFGVCAAAFLAATVVFGLTVRPDLHVG